MEGHSTNAIRSVAHLALTFVVTALLLAAGLVATAFIPRSAIERHMRASAEYLCQAPLFDEVVEGVACSKIDHYADAILLGIAWQYDAGDPLHSVMSSSYYHEDNKEATKNLLRAVTEGLPANREYIRYWHGSLLIVRPLLTLLSVQGIYMLNAAALALLIASLILRLGRRGASVPLVGIGASLIGVSCWYVPLSLEYTWVFLIVLIQLHVVLCKRFARTTLGRMQFFLVSGMLTSYLDFLTTELLTLLLPLLLVLWMDRDEDRGLVSLGSLAVLVAAWGVGYAGMWAFKWLMASVVLGVDYQRTVGFHVMVRSSALVADSAAQQCWEAVQRNVGCLFPLGYGGMGVVCALVVLAAALYAAHTHRQNDVRVGLVVRYGVLGIVPFIRFVVLNNHSYLHYFFSYRVLAATLFAFVLALGEVAYRKQE